MGVSLGSASCRAANPSMGRSPKTDGLANLFVTFGSLTPGPLDLLRRSFALFLRGIFLLLIDVEPFLVVRDCGA
jgi:hypothetical protein